MNFETYLNSLILRYDIIPRFKYEYMNNQNCSTHLQYTLWQLRDVYEKLAAGETNDILVRQKLTSEHAPAILWELIAKYMESRNILLALDFIKHYIDMDYPGAKIMESFYGSLINMIQIMSEVLKKRTAKDVFLIFIDSLTEKHVQDMPFLREFAERNYSFNRAYSTSIYTLPCVHGALTGELITDRESLQNHEFGTGNGLPEYFKKKGYYLYNFSGFRFLMNAIYPFVLTKFSVGKAHTPFKGNEKIKYTTPTILWSYLCEMAKNPDKPVFAVTLLEEFHLPMIGEWHTKAPINFDREMKYKRKRKYKPENMERQRKEVLSFLNNQLAFFSALAPPNTIKIFTADHGQLLGEHGHLGPGMTWHTENCHVPLIIGGINGKHEKVFSMANFPDVLMNYVQTGNIEVIQNGYARVQRDAIFDKRFKEKVFCKAIGEKFATGWDMLIGEKDKYVKTDEGFEEYSLLTDEDTDLIRKPEYQDRIEGFRNELVGTRKDL